MCHRIPERSFFFRGKQFPICARCTGIMCGYLVAIICLLFVISFTFIVSILLLIPMVIDGTGQLYKKWESTNSRRFITGLLAGVGIILFIVDVTMFNVHLGQNLYQLFSE
ncbi:DUF2085 domain-containing protein [Paenisporosarcina indica]|uniref:DUF2085 domain-containing protein n=1 Tax=Paenisporosarcina indica TaxID=650093 RepID=UPI001FE3771E|nr:DUF2085 domain-containing protein [Paenisporosarcina indica]